MLRYLAWGHEDDLVRSKASPPSLLSSYTQATARDALSHSGGEESDEPEMQDVDLRVIVNEEACKVAGIDFSTEEFPETLRLSPTFGLHETFGSEI